MSNKETKGENEMVKSVFTNEIYQYIKKNVNGSKRIVGVMVAAIDEPNNRVCISWSKANFKHGDEFDRETGLKIARERLNAKETIPVPYSIEKDLDKFINRCKRYYQCPITYFPVEHRHLSKQFVGNFQTMIADTN